MRVGLPTASVVLVGGYPLASQYHMHVVREVGIVQQPAPRPHQLVQVQAREHLQHQALRRHVVGLVLGRPHGVKGVAATQGKARVARVAGGKDAEEVQLPAEACKGLGVCGSAGHPGHQLQHRRQAFVSQPRRRTLQELEQHHQELREHHRGVCSGAYR